MRMCVSVIQDRLKQAIRISAAMTIMATPVFAEKASVKYFSQVPLPSAEALAKAKPAKLPKLSFSQMKTSGLISDNGAVSRSAASTWKLLNKRPGILSKGSTGVPTLDPVVVYPPMLIPKTVDGAKTVEGASLTQGVNPQLSQGGVAPMAYGTIYEWPFTTSRVEISGKLINSKLYPNRTSGKLFVYYPNGGVSVCSASLIRKGIVVTAAHCIASYGSGIKSSGAVFYPGFFNGKAPYGSAGAVAAFVLPSYLNGTDGCSVAGIVCLNDIAVLVLDNKRGKYIGSRTGWLDVGTIGWASNRSGATQITQLGYPVGIDYGNQMIRNDSLGQIWDATNAFNTLIGSSMDGGSSGGPWLANFGVPGVPNNVSTGYSANPNVLVGVTSWGFIGSTVAVTGASPFTADNIGVLLNNACTAYPLACAP